MELSLGERGGGRLGEKTVAHICRISLASQTLLSPQLQSLPVCGTVLGTIHAGDESRV